MAKAKNEYIYFCNECGYESTKWMGQCPACKAWNSFVEEKVDKKTVATVGTKRAAMQKEDSVPVTFAEISVEEEERIMTGMSELDRVLGGGIVRGSLILVGGDPGIGKSTLLLQACRNLSADAHEVLYISGEESLRQIKLRATRIGDMTEHVRLLCETNLENIVGVVSKCKPEIVIIDSIQTMYSDSLEATPGSVSQVREATAMLMRMAKDENVSVFIVGHVTKEGTVAGPRVLEHMVDTVLYFEGDRHASYRILRGVKNRFGSTNEIGVFEMREEGLIEVTNPSEYMLSGRPAQASGAVVACSIEGTRPILVEVQALVNETAFAIPRRTATGTDFNRVNLLMAVLEKRCHLPVGKLDAYVNIAGGVRMSEPALDLAIVMAIVSSLNDKPVDEHTVFFGEVGLSGEVRAVSMGEHRIREAAKLGFTRAIVPKTVADRINKTEGISVIGVSTVSEAIYKAMNQQRAKE